MNRVTINDLAWDYRHTATCEDVVNSADIEVVPRKMVEKCEKDEVTYLGAVAKELDIIRKRYVTLFPEERMALDIAISVLSIFENTDIISREKALEMVEKNKQQIAIYRAIEALPSADMRGK